MTYSRRETAETQRTRRETRKEKRVKRVLSRFTIHSFLSAHLMSPQFNKSMFEDAVNASFVILSGAPVLSLPKGKISLKGVNRVVHTRCYGG
jgi:hypothetical protein